MLKRAAIAIVVLLTAMPVQQALGAPLNDEMQNAITISEVPFTTTMSTEGATADPLLEPYSWCGIAGATLWFRYEVPTSGPLTFHTRGSDFDTILNVYRRMPSGGLQEVNCNHNEYRSGQGFLESSWVAFKARAGDELFIQVGGAQDLLPYPGTGRGQTGTLVLTVEPSPDERLPFHPPLNDDRGQATPIEQLPFTDSVHLNSASGEPSSDEEAGCWPSDSALNWRNLECRTVWYRYDADRDTHLTGRGHAQFGPPTIQVFRQSEDGLEPIGRSEAGYLNEYGTEWDYDISHVFFPVSANDTIWIQMSNSHTDPDPASEFRLEELIVDFDVQGIRVVSGEDLDDPMRFIADVEMSRRSAYVYEFVACPVGGPAQSCFQFWLDRDEQLWYEGTHTTVERSWYAASCVGDFDITARVWYPFAFDPDPSNNSATMRVSIKVPSTGVGAGFCPLP